MSRILIIGAAGFVGQEIVKKLLAENHQLLAITNPNGQILLDQYEIDILDSDSYDQIEDIDIIINLAYPKGVSPKEEKKKNNHLHDIIIKLAGKGTKVIHISTLAVFGYELEFPIVPTQIKSRLDHAYITSKIYLENKLVNSLKNNELHIVRLGNVWGPASPLWTVNLINRILLGEVVGIAGKDGYSNVTDVTNVASYINFLVNYDGSKGVLFHHLGEFSEIKWSHWIKIISDKLQLEPVYIDYEPSKDITIANEVISAISAASPMNIGKSLIRGQYSGSLIRKVLAISPEALVNFLDKKSIKMNFFPDYYNIGLIDTFMKVISCEKQFESVTIGDWSPEIDLDLSWSKVDNWIDSAGYFGVKL